LATHGYFFPNPTGGKKGKSGYASVQHPLLRSGLILAGANRAWSGEEIPDGEEDGILTAYEIADMDLSNTELVVLSACETGLGDVDGSEGVFGLQRAFKTAGVKYILMSLWNVKDQKTYEFMTAFYELRNKGKDIPAAYQEAQAKMRAKYALPFAPRNWAGFVLLN
jgi:CHAT domain-containing protein